MKKNQIGVLVAILVVLMFSISWGEESQNENPKKDYLIKVLVPNEIIIVECMSNKLNPTSSLSRGITEISKEYVIKSATSINESYGFGSRTVSLILFVEPRK